MNFTETLAGLKETFKAYDAVGLLDDVSIYNWYVDSLKEFGGLPYETYEEVLEVRNWETRLPDGFRKLEIAIKCEPHTYETKHKDHLQESRFWIERHVKTNKWDSCEPVCEEAPEKVIVEKLYYRDYESTYYYNRPHILGFVRGMNRKLCTSNCKNLHVKNSPYNININKGKVIKTNFKEGNIFIRYRGFEEDEDGFIEVPETFNGHLENYVESHIKAKIMESIVANNDNTGSEQALLQLYRQDARDSKVKAMTELKANSFNKGSLIKYGKRLRGERKKIEAIF